MNLFNFSVHFGSEQDYITHFKAQRDKQEVIYSRCGHTKHYWIKS